MFCVFGADGLVTDSLKVEGYYTSARARVEACGVC